MGERLGMQSESWRPQRGERGFDPQFKRMALIAGGVVAVLALGYAGYAVLGRGPGAVPVIEADSRPVRVRPDNPGGMQVAGAEEQIMGDGASGQTDTMAPPPEVPQPQALRAQIQAARQSVQPPPVASLAAPPTAAPPPVISTAPEQRAVVPPTARPPVSRPLAAVTGGTGVQLAAMDTEAAAMAEWQRLSRRMPDLLGARHPAVQRADHDGKPIFRLRTGGFTDVAQAAAFCTQVRSKGGGCTIASF